MAILAETVEKSSEIAIRDSYRTQPVSAYPKIDTRFRGDAERRRQGRTHHCRGVNFGLSADSHHGGDTVHFDSGQLQFEFSVQPFGRRHFQPARHIHPNFVFAGGTPVQITHRQNHRYAERVGQTRTHTDVEILPQLIDENDSAVGQYAAPCYLTRHGINAATQRGDQAPSFGDGGAGAIRSDSYSESGRDSARRPHPRFEARHTYNRASPTMRRVVPGRFVSRKETACTAPKNATLLPNRICLLLRPSKKRTRGIRYSHSLARKER